MQFEFMRQSNLHRQRKTDGQLVNTWNYESSDQLPEMLSVDRSLRSTMPMAD